jgi:hypothetical protein
VQANDFRRIALGMKDAVEGAHMDHPDFRAGGRIFATLHPDSRHGMVKLSPEQQREFIERHGDAFAPESGAWGRQGCTAVDLERVDEETLGEAITLAWQNAARQVQAKKSTARRKADGRRRK